MKLNILAGKSNLEQVKECDVPVEEVMEADEVFCTGTAVGITPVASITYQDQKYVTKVYTIYKYMFKLASLATVFSLS